MQTLQNQKDSGLDESLLENVKRLPDGSIRAGCPACIAAGSDSSKDHLLIQPDAKFGCAAHPADRAHRQEIFKLAAKRSPLPATNGHANGTPARIVATYDYQDASGKLLFQVCRFALKDFRQRKPDATALDGWQWKTRGVEKVLFRLPEIIRDVARGLPIFICEGEKDVLEMARHGFSATCNPGGAGKWEAGYTDILRDAHCIVIPDKDAPGRAHAQLVAGKLHGKAKSIRILELPDIGGKPVKDAFDFFAAGGDAGLLQDMVDSAPEWTPPIKIPAGPQGDDLQRAIADERPKIRLPGPDRLLSDFATELGEELQDKDIYYRNGEIVILDGSNLKRITPQVFRCWSEKYFIGYRAKTIGENTFEFNVTMTDTEAGGTLAAPQFTSSLRQVRRINNVRLPIFDTDGKLALLPCGYHEPTQTLTVEPVEYDLNLTVERAIEILDDLLSEFCFADGMRSKAVAIAAMLGLYANQLLPDKSLRPCFNFAANAEGAGKTILSELCILPTCGDVPTGCKSTEDNEIRKNLTTAIKEVRLVVYFDNLKGRLSSPALEAFLSAPIWQDRKLGVNENIVGENLATCFVTGNGMTVSPDMRRRSLFVELHLEVERAEDRKFKRLLDRPTLLAMRPTILAALWAIVRNWDANGRPGPSRGHSAFPSWANIIGGIVEAGGFDCPLATANVTASADPDSDDMRKLVEAMAGKSMPLTFADLVQLARANGLFENIIGPDNEELGRREKAALGNLLKRYDRRSVLKYRFSLDGKGHNRRYQVEPIK